MNTSAPKTPNLFLPIRVLVEGTSSSEPSASLILSENILTRLGWQLSDKISETRLKTCFVLRSCKGFRPKLSSKGSAWLSEAA